MRKYFKLISVLLNFKELVINKSIILGIFLTLLSNTIYCQESSNPDDFINNALSLSPLSPEAASLGKYGDIPVNLATGRINL